MATRGDFSFISDLNERQMLEDAFQAVTIAEGWNFLKDPSVPGEHGFMFSAHPMMTTISEKMKYQGHSGSSHALTMRLMEFIAKKGWDTFVKDTLVNRIKNYKYEKLSVSQLLQIQTLIAESAKPVPVVRTNLPPEDTNYTRSDTVCGCRAAKGYTTGWCGVAGGGVPGCDH